MVSLDKKGRINMWENFEEVIDEDILRMNHGRMEISNQYLHNGI